MQRVQCRKGLGRSPEPRALPPGDPAEAPVASWGGGPASQLNVGITHPSTQTLGGWLWTGPALPPHPAFSSKPGDLASFPGNLGSVSDSGSGSVGLPMWGAVPWLLRGRVPPGGGDPVHWESSPGAERSRAGHGEAERPRRPEARGVPAAPDAGSCLQPPREGGRLASGRASQRTQATSGTSGASLFLQFYTP